MSVQVNDTGKDPVVVNVTGGGFAEVELAPFKFQLKVSVVLPVVLLLTEEAPLKVAVNGAAQAFKDAGVFVIDTVGLIEIFIRLFFVIELSQPKPSLYTRVTLNVPGIVYM